MLGVHNQIRSRLATAAALFASLLLPAGAMAGGDAGEEPPPAVSAAPPTAAAPAPPTCRGEGVIGQVVALAGAAHAEARDGTHRALACDDLIRACETVVTTPGARAGIVSRDIYAEIDGDARLRIGLDEDAPAFLLEAGGVRVLDSREAGAAPLHVETPQAIARGQGADTEVWVRADSISRLCIHQGSLEVGGRSGTPVTVGTNVCAETDGGATHTLPGVAPTIEVAGPLACGFEVEGIAQLFSPTDVAAPPFGLGNFPDVRSADPFLRSACDSPGSGCGGTPRVLPTTRRRPPPIRRIPVPIVQEPPGGDGGGPGF